MLYQYVDQYVTLAKTLHSTHVPAGSFTSLREVFHLRADELTEWCSAEEIALEHELVDAIPDSDTVTHNDLHPGNIMLQNDELVLIDMPEVTIAPPICDLVSIYRDMISAPKGNTAEHIVRSVGMPKDMILSVGNMFFEKYTGISDPAELEAYYGKLGLLYAVNVVLAAGGGSERAMKSAPIIMDMLLRGVVAPNEQAIRQLYKAL